MTFLAVVSLVLAFSGVFGILQGQMSKPNSKNQEIRVLDRGGSTHDPRGHQMDVICPAGTSPKEALAAAMAAMAVLQNQKLLRRFVDRFCDGCGDNFEAIALTERVHKRRFREFFHSCGTRIIAVHKYGPTDRSVLNPEFSMSIEDLLVSRAKATAETEAQRLRDDPNNIGEQLIARN